MKSVYHNIELDRLALKKLKQQIKYKLKEEESLERAITYGRCSNCTSPLSAATDILCTECQSGMK